MYPEWKRGLRTHHGVMAEQSSNPFSAGMGNRKLVTQSSKINASRRAHTHLKTVERDLVLLRMMSLMSSYLTFFLTIEYAIVPRIREKHPEWETGM